MTRGQKVNKAPTLVVAAWCAEIEDKYELHRSKIALWEVH